jgi:hypothetical protein
MGCTIWGVILGRVKRFFIQTGSGPHPGSYSVGTKVRNEWNYTSVSPYMCSKHRRGQCMFRERPSYIETLYMSTMANGYMARIELFIKQNIVFTKM